MNQKLEAICKNASLELHPESPVPLYYQLSRFLLQLIQDEAFQPGDRFPTEEAVGNYFHVSRPTANKSIQLLLDEGFLTRDKGLGTFVKEKPFLEFTFLGQGLSFADQFPPEVPIKNKRIWVKTVPATKNVAKHLNLEEGDLTILLRRLRFVHDRPFMVCDSQLPAKKFPGIAECEFVQDSLYQTLSAKFNAQVVRSERYTQSMEAIEPEIIKLLGIHPFSSVLVISGVSYTLDDEPVDFLRTTLGQGVILKTIVQIESNTP